jgi:hypothetical protein
MSKQNESTEPTITVTPDMLKAMLDGMVADALAKRLSAKSPDEAMREAMDRQRGKDRPKQPVWLVDCESPITGARFTARIVPSRAYPEGRVVEMLNYVRPAGWDRKKQDGGLYHDGEEWPILEADGRPSKVFARWVYLEFWSKDMAEIGGKALRKQWMATNTDGTPIAPRPEPEADPVVQE